LNPSTRRASLQHHFRPSSQLFCNRFRPHRHGGLQYQPDDHKTSAEEESLGAPTMTVFNAPPIILQTEIQKRNAGVNAVVGWHADLDDGEGDKSKTIGTCNGTMQVTRLEKDTEHRMTMIGFNWKKSDDSLVAGGSQPDPSSPTETATPII
jgi:hypothetical protein